MPRLPEILLRDLQLDRLARLVECSEQRRSRLAHLKIDGTVLDLDDDVVVELAVKSVEIVVRRASAIVLRIAPIHVVVVNKAAIENQAAVRLERAGDHVGSVRVRPVIRRRSDAAFRIGLEDEAAEIRHRPIDLVGFGFPPGDDGGIQRIEGIESADFCGLPKSTANATLTPQGRNASAMRTICGISSTLRNLVSALTLLIAQPLMPSEASRRPYSRTRDKSSRAWPLSQKIEGPP